MNLKKISVIITTFNEGANLSRCLGGVTGFGEVIVVDSFSTDDTLEIARSSPAMIYCRPYQSAAQQKNWALENVRYKWVLILDADEMLTAELKREIEELDPGSIAGYWIRRESDYLGRTIHHCGWQRDKVLRLFDCSAGKYEDREVHEEIRLDGRAGVLRNKLRHFPYSEVEQHIAKIEAYSTRGAKDLARRGGRFVLLSMLFHPPFRFLRMYFLQRGILDGSQGFILCLLASYSVFLKYAKAWEIQKCRRKA